jgi:hypothetical protein
MRKRLAGEKTSEKKEKKLAHDCKEDDCDKANAGRAIDPLTGKFLFDKFSYPTYYISDTHHLALKNKNSKSEFIVMPNGVLPKKRVVN